MPGETMHRIPRPTLMVGEVIELARGVVSRRFGERDGFWGAYLAGSINQMDHGAEFPAYLDVDIRVVLESVVREEIETLHDQGYLLKCNISPSLAYRSSEGILALPGQACDFIGQNILADPDNRLMPIQRDVVAGFAQRKWVARRVAASLNSAEEALEGLRASADALETLRALDEFILCCSACLSVAHLAPPTHRRSLTNLKTLLGTQAREQLYESVLQVLGAPALGAQEVRWLLSHCLDAFDRGLAVRQQSVPFDWMLNARVRDHLYNGTLATIAEGAHREAVFWMLRFFYTALVAIQRDGTPHDKLIHGTRLMRFLGVLGLESEAGLQTRMALCEALIGNIRAYVEEVVETSPLLVD